MQLVPLRIRSTTSFANTELTRKYNKPTISLLLTQERGFFCAIIVLGGVELMNADRDFKNDSGRIRLSSQEERFSDRFTDDEIARAWHEAYKKVGAFVMPEERR